MRMLSSSTTDDILDTAGAVLYLVPN